MTRGSSGEDRAAEGLAPALRGGGLRLPGLKHWRSRRGLGQVELAKRAGTNQRQISRMERGLRGCNPSTAQKLTEALGVKLQDLQTKYEPAVEVSAEPGSGRPARPRIVYRQVHQAYAKILLGRAVGSAYAAMGERELERHCGGSPGRGLSERSPRGGGRWSSSRKRCGTPICPGRCACSWRRR